MENETPEIVRHNLSGYYIYGRCHDGKYTRIEIDVGEGRTYLPLLADCVTGAVVFSNLVPNTEGILDKKFLVPCKIAIEFQRPFDDKGAE